MSKLTWIACNGVKPDLPEGTDVHIMVASRSTDTWHDSTVNYSQFELWPSVVCYALEPVDPVEELVEAAHDIAYLPHSETNKENWTRLRAAIKAVEEMG